VLASLASSAAWRSRPPAGLFASRVSRYRRTDRPCSRPSASAVLCSSDSRAAQPAQLGRAVPLTFANAVSEDEVRELYETFAVPAPDAPLFQAATANLNPWTEAKIDSKNPERLDSDSS